MTSYDFHGFWAKYVILGKFSECWLVKSVISCLESFFICFSIRSKHFPVCLRKSVNTFRYLKHALRAHTCHSVMLLKKIPYRTKMTVFSPPESHFGLNLALCGIKKCSFRKKNEKQKPTKALIQLISTQTNITHLDSWSYGF